jgi:predicted Fe-Mo cluster-binding NifX family protein
MKIAFVTEDEQTISAHFGRAPKVVVITLQDGKEVGREVRPKEAHGQGGQGGGVHLHDEHEGHSHEHHHQHNHGGMFASMQDCDVMVVCGIGSPALAHAENAGLRVFLPAEKHIDAALASYMAGTLESDERRIHHH